MNAEHEIVVAGAGAAGQFTAVRLAQSGFDVLLLDAAEEAAAQEAPDEYDLRVVALAPASRAAFEAAGAWSGRLPRRAGAYRSMSVWGEGGGGIAFDCAELGLPELGHIVEVPELQRALDAAPSSGLTRWQAARVRELREDATGLSVGLSDGRSVRCRLLVGADGIESRVRTRSGIHLDRRDYGQTAVVAMLQPERPHGEVARQVFCAEGPLGVLPLANGAVSIVWSVATADAARLLDLSDDALGEALTARMDELGRLRVISARAAFPLRMLHARSYCAARVMLVGDAAHVVHPLAGLGLNLGFGDGVHLADGLARVRAAGGDWSGHGNLTRLARDRRAQVRPALAFIDGLERLFSVGRTGLGGAALGLADQLAPLKREFMRRAVGEQRAL